MELKWLKHVGQVNDGLEFEDGNCLIRECPEPNITNETFYPWETWMSKTQRQSVAPITKNDSMYTLNICIFIQRIQTKYTHTYAFLRYCHLF